MNSLIAVTRFTLELIGQYGAGRKERRYVPQLERLALWRRVLWLCAFCVLAGAMLTYPLEASALQFFDGIEEEAGERGQGWFQRIRDLVRPTFMALGAIEIAWAAAIWAFERDNLSSFAVEVAKKLMTIGFFFMLLEKAPEWLPTILGTFEVVGAEATDQPRELSTDTILGMGFKAAANMYLLTKAFAMAVMLVPITIFGTTIPGATALHEHARGVVMVAGLGAVIIVISYVIVAAQYFCLKVEAAVLFAAGAVFLGMGSSSWTRDYVSKYLNYAINVGVRMLVLILILSITLEEANRFSPTAIADMNPILELVAISVLQAILAMKVPELAGALLSGGSGLSAGSVAGAGGGLVRSMASGAMAAVNAAKGVGNLVKAANASRGGGGGGVGQHAGASASNMPGGGNANAGSGSSVPGLAGSSGNGGGTGGVRGGASGGRLSDAAGQASGDRTRMMDNASSGRASPTGVDSSARGSDSSSTRNASSSASSSSATNSLAQNSSAQNSLATSSSAGAESDHGSAAASVVTEASGDLSSQQAPAGVLDDSGSADREQAPRSSIDASSGTERSSNVGSLSPRTSSSTPTPPTSNHVGSMRKGSVPPSNISRDEPPRTPR